MLQFGGDEVDALGNLGLDYVCSVTADALPQVTLVAVSAADA